MQKNIKDQTIFFSCQSFETVTLNKPITKPFLKGFKIYTMFPWHKFLPFVTLKIFRMIVIKFLKYAMKQFDYLVISIFVEKLNSFFKGTSYARLFYKFYVYHLYQ